jgi:hypothetical protein
MRVGRDAPPPSFYIRRRLDSCCYR